MSNLTKLALATAALCLLAAAAAIFSYGSDDSTAGEAPTAAPSELSATDQLIDSLLQRTAARSGDADGRDQLGFAYLQKARETADPTLYARAEQAFQASLERRPSGQSSLIGLSSVEMARHNFAGALALAEQALAAGPETPDAFGALGDALIELGRYEEGVAVFQRMADLRPDLNSYVRVSYARELHGEVSGAIEAMELAVTAGGPTGENAAWVRMQLATLHFNRGDLDSARIDYESSLRAFPGYVYAVAGLARISAAEGDYDRAIELYTDVTERQPLHQYVAALGDVYAADGQGDEAARQYALVSAIADLYETNGISTDLEMALFFADHDLRLEDALSAARAVYDQQPGSIYAADALAWALYKSGRATEALPYAQQALRLGTRDAALLLHAGLIRHALGDDASARSDLERSLVINPHFSVLNSPLAEQALASLDDD